MSTYLPIVQHEYYKEALKLRHYYLKMAYGSIKLRHPGDIHRFSLLAEGTQGSIDEMLRYYPQLAN